MDYFTKFRYSLRRAKIKATMKKGVISLTLTNSNRARVALIIKSCRDANGLDVCPVHFKSKTKVEIIDTYCDHFDYKKKIKTSDDFEYQIRRANFDALHEG